MGRLYVRFDKILEFENRYVIALFLRMHPEVHYIRYIKGYYFEAEMRINNSPKRVVVSLFTNKGLSDPQKTSYGVASLSQVSYRITRPNYNGDDTYDKKVQDGFATVYRKYSANPLQHILNTVESVSTDYGSRTALSNDPVIALLQEYNNDYIRYETEELLFKYKQMPDTRFEKEEYVKASGYLKKFIDGELTFVNPRKFNDPFDSDCEIPHLVLKHLWRLYNSRIIKNSEGKNPSFEDVFEHYSSLFKQYLEEDASDPQEKALKNIYSLYFTGDYPEEVVNRYLNIKDSFRVLCLTPHYDDILMWGYYAESGSGVCGGFRASSIKNGVEKERSNYIFIYGNVKYATDINKAKYTGQDLFSFVVECVFTKSGIWDHEDERRFLLVENTFASDYITVQATCEKYYLGVSANETRWTTEFDSSSRLHKLKKHKTEYRLIE
ncbi:MAG: DUF2971 domain-containing protein [Clostridiales bacterium]|nr:DUF2971 domain-containing protein [Clostridiales bacterium]